MPTNVQTNLIGRLSSKTLDNRQLDSRPGAAWNGPD
jgi:hypothetical protein